MTPAVLLVVAELPRVIWSASLGYKLQPAPSAWFISAYSAVRGFWSVELSTGRLGASH
jgi:hypothetical protein